LDITDLVAARNVRHADGLVSAVKVLRTKLGHEIIHKFEQCDKNKCGAYLQYKKQPKDKAMQKDLIRRREHCVE